jgi:hypothetical protein
METAAPMAHRGRRYQAWLALVLAVAVAIVSIYPFPHYLIAVGAVPILLAQCTQSFRMTKDQENPPLTILERWTVETGGILFVVSIIAAFIRPWLS